MAEIVLEVRGLAGMAANFKGILLQTRENIRDANDRAGKDTVKLARQLVPKDTRRTERAITYELTELGMAVNIFVDPAPYEADGVSYYAPYIEHGTSNPNYPAQPFMFPAWEAIRPHYQEDMRAAIRNSIADHRVK